MQGRNNTRGDNRTKRMPVLVIMMGLLLAAGAAGQARAWDMVMWPGYGSHHHHGKSHGRYYRSLPPWYRVPGNGGSACGYLYNGWPGYGPDRSAFGSTLSRGEAKKLVQWMIRFDINLEVGDIREVDRGYEVTLVTRKGKRSFDTLLVEKDTACVYSIYRPVEE